MLLCLLLFLHLLLFCLVIAIGSTSFGCRMSTDGSISQGDLPQREIKLWNVEQQHLELGYRKCCWKTCQCHITTSGSPHQAATPPSNRWNGNSRKHSNYNSTFDILSKLRRRGCVCSFWSLPVIPDPSSSQLEGKLPRWTDTQ